jgi:DNA-binding MarR family transcriptional regulator
MAAGDTGRRPLANDAWEALLSAHAVLLREFAAQGIWRDISMREYDVLYTLSKCPEPIRLSELNRHVLLSQPALSRMVDRLAGRGLIERAVDFADRRGVRLALTETGQAAQREIGRRHARGVARAMSSRLSAAELWQLERLCGKLAQADSDGLLAPPPDRPAPRAEISAMSKDEDVSA